ncbi:hypothetical protein MJ563_18530 [Klebsiella pneumoniae]|nr:hypothetical protein MJ563_18530 [Klebsiella pneumoniae]
MVHNGIEYGDACS